MKEEADRLGLVSKRRAFANGRSTGGVALTRGRIFHLLSNPIYVGEIRHGTKRYPGQHPAIIDRATFEAVSAKLEANTRGDRQTDAATATVLTAGRQVHRRDRRSPDPVPRGAARQATPVLCLAPARCP